MRVCRSALSPPFQRKSISSSTLSSIELNVGCSAFGRRGDTARQASACSAETFGVGGLDVCLVFLSTTNSQLSSSKCLNHSGFVSLRPRTRTRSLGIGRACSRTWEMFRSTLLKLCARRRALVSRNGSSAVPMSAGSLVLPINRRLSSPAPARSGGTDPPTPIGAVCDWRRPARHDCQRVHRTGMATARPCRSAYQRNNRLVQARASRPAFTSRFR